MGRIKHINIGMGKASQHRDVFFLLLLLDIIGHRCFSTLFPCKNDVWVVFTSICF